jgi:hypothetical protein
MGAATYVVLEKPVPDLGSSLDGKAISQAEHVLSPLARELGVTPLMDFFSMSREDFEAQAEQFNTLAGVEDAEVPDERWFPAGEGLRTVRALVVYLEDHPDAVERPGRVLDDLRDFSEVLEEADRRGIRWHLGIDY